jgi:hypothetical protein
MVEGGPDVVEAVSDNHGQIVGWFSRKSEDEGYIILLGFQDNFVRLRFAVIRNCAFKSLDVCAGSRQFAFDAVDGKWHD